MVNTMLGLINTTLYIIAAGVGVKAMWAARGSKFLYSITFISSAVCAYSALLYFGYVTNSHFDLLGSWEDLKWALSHALKAGVLIAFHLYTMDKTNA